MNDPDYVCVDNQSIERIARAIFVASEQNCTGFVELLHAAAIRRISLTAVFNPRFSWTPRMLRSDLPAVVLISDDAGDPRDPDQWRCSVSAIAWAQVAVVHGTGAEVWHYRALIEAALVKKRALMVETDSDHAPAWSAAILPRQIPILHIIPPAGGEHPAVTA